MAAILTAIYNWILAHSTMVTLLAYHIAIAFTTSLEMPSTDSGAFYRFFFKFVNGLAANYARAQASTTSAGYQPPRAATIPGPQIPTPPKGD